MSDNSDQQTPIGKVYLVGAGPGDRKLITIRGQECLEKADVVVYDRLINPQLLSFCLPESERIYVGKQVGSKRNQQNEINQILVKKAKMGKTVVRLKGGDPLVFGRGGEEVFALSQANIEFEIVPGITSGLAVPAYAGIPITDRNLASSVLFVAGHKADDSDINWKVLANSVDTIVIFMGARKIPNITSSLLKHGRSPATPVAVIRLGTTAQQETIVGSLNDIQQKSDHLQPPVIIVVGKVVDLRQYGKWFEQKPLFSRTILITRPAEQSREIVNLLEDGGAEVVTCPMVEITPIDPNDELRLAIQDISRYNWIVFTSPNAVQIFNRKLMQLGLDSRALAKNKICAVSAKTLQMLESIGIRADFFPSEPSGEGIGSELPIQTEQRVLLPRSEIGQQKIVKLLQRRGGIVNDLPIYCTTPPHQSDSVEQIRSVQKRLVEAAFDMIVFTSPSTIQNFLIQPQHVEGFIPQQILLNRVETAVIGQTTKSFANEHGIPVSVVAKEPSMAHLAQDIIRFFQNQK